MTTVRSQCELCTRFDHTRTDANTCEAYPRGIPPRILMNQASHLVPQPGDHGLQFDPLTPQAEQEVRDMFPEVTSDIREREPGVA